MGVNSVHLTMGTGAMLRLKNGKPMFLTIDVSFPDDVFEFLVYYIEPDNSLTPAGVDGMYRGTMIRQGGTILAVRPDTPEEGRITYTIGLLLTHLSEYAIGSILPPENVVNMDDDYSACFIKSASDGFGMSSPRTLLVILLTVIGIMFLLKQRHRSYMVLLIIVSALVVGLVLSPSKTFAAEGSAAGVPGLGVPAPIQEEPRELEESEAPKQKKSDYVPAAASSARRPEVKKEPPKTKAIKSGKWFIHAGAGYAFINKEISASLDEETISHQLDSDIYPFLRGSYEFSDRFSVELGIALDFYGGSVTQSQSGDSSNLSGYTTLLNAVYCGKDISLPWIGKWRPLALAGIGYRIIDANLDYPVSDYKPGFGLVVGVGARKGNLEVRVGYGNFSHDPDGEEEGYSSTEDVLDTSGISFEISYGFEIF